MRRFHSLAGAAPSGAGEHRLESWGCTPAAGRLEFHPAGPDSWPECWELRARAGALSYGRPAVCHRARCVGSAAHWQDQGMEGSDRPLREGKNR